MQYTCSILHPLTFSFGSHIQFCFVSSLSLLPSSVCPSGRLCHGAELSEGTEPAGGALLRVPVAMETALRVPAASDRQGSERREEREGRGEER